MVACASGPVLRICSRIDSVRRVELVVGHDVAHQAHGGGISGVDLGRGEEQEPRPGQADHVDQAGADMWGSGRPRRSSGTRKRARSDATLTSQCSARSSPPAMQAPLIFATQSLRQRSM